jgi:hypothetical protein
MASKNVAYPPDDLDSLKEKRNVIAGKIEALRNQMRELEAKDMGLERMIFEREDGRLAKAAREVMLNDPAVKKAIDHVLEKLEIGGVAKLGKRGRPTKLSKETQDAMLKSVAKRGGLTAGA